MPDSPVVPNPYLTPATHAAVVSNDCLVAAAEQFLQDPKLFSQLSDRVYELWLTDLRHQRERSKNYHNSRF